MDKKAIADLAAQIGLNVDENNIEGSIANLESRSDAELMAEIARIKRQMAQNPAAWNQYMGAVKMMMPMLNGAQQKRLKQIIRLLEQ